MDVLITHECSGRVREAFLARGHNAFSCDLKPAEDGSPRHIQGDAIAAIRSRRWDLVGMHCECRYLCGSGTHWNKRRPERAVLTEQAYQHVIACRDAATEHADAWYLENSVGVLSTRWRKPDQIVQPYQFGDDASKATCLWLHGLPHLTAYADQWCKPRHVCPKCGLTYAPGYGAAWRDRRGVVRCHQCDTPMRSRWANQTDSGQNRLPPSEDRSAKRALTYPGIARAMAETWGGLEPALISERELWEDKR